MLRHSHFKPTPALKTEWLARLWQGQVPPDLVIRLYLYLPTDPRELIVVWDGGAEAEAFFEDAFAPFGDLHTHVVQNATTGMVAALERNLEAFRLALAGLGRSPLEIDQEIALRRLGLNASSPEEAREAARNLADKGH